MNEFPCPHCSVPLRARDHSQRGQTIECPDCGQPVLLEYSEGRIVGRPAEENVFELPAPKRSARPFLLWFLGVGIAVGAGIIMLNWQSATKEELGATEGGQAGTPTDAGLSSEGPGGTQPSHAGTVNSEVADRLLSIHKLIKQFSGRQGRYPSGLSLESDDMPPHGRANWSWIAELYQDGFDDGIVPVWEERWNVPVNDPFVRRRLDAFLNPHLRELTGRDRYPAAHFAGVTGVGPDSATLPLRHPRGGMFSTVHQTRISDVLDGTANTIMITGVQSQLGSWARTGQATLRSFNREPYVNGPDGMGTGQPDSMLVLMADGSVRTLSANTVPKIARRMAAIADGMTLDPETPGDPLLTEAPGSPIVDAGPQLPRDDLILPELAPDGPSFDVGRQLQQEIESYKLETPVEIGKLLYEFQEISGVPVDVSAVTAEELQQAVAIEREKTTLHGLLEGLTEAAGLSFRIEPNQIRIVSAADTELR